MFEEPAAAAQLLSAPADAIATSYDILAVQPLSERALQQVCSRPARQSLCAAVKLPQIRCIWALLRLVGPQLLKTAQLQEQPLMALDAVQPPSEEVLQHKCRGCACVSVHLHYVRRIPNSSKWQATPCRKQAGHDATTQDFTPFACLRAGVQFT